MEKSRIVTHSNDERNYHVFYELLEGFDTEEKRKYGLTSPEKYFYLNQVRIEDKNERLSKFFVVISGRIDGDQ